MEQVLYSSHGWESWAVEHKPTMPEGMPILIDGDLRFEDGAAAPRPTIVLNRWLRELPINGCPTPDSWAVYAQVLRDWVVFLAEHGVEVFDTRTRLKMALGAYAAHRGAGPLKARFKAVTWNRHVSILASFYRWAVDEEYAAAQPFTYRQATSFFPDQTRSRPANQAVRRAPKAHVTIKYLDKGFTTLFLRALRGLGPDGEDRKYRGRHLARNAAVGALAVATGLRRREFTYLLAAEVPALPPRPTELPLPFPVPDAVAKGGKFRTTWISYEALAEVHGYLELERALATDGSPWRPPARWGPPLLVSEFDQRGGRVNGRRLRWDSLRARERRRLVAPGGGSMLVAVRADGGPFTAWPTVFARTADRIRERFEPRFGHMWPHRLRHTFAIATLEDLVGGYYAQAAQLTAATGPADGPDAALALYLSKADPVMVLRDLLGHSTVTTTEAYLRRLDMMRIYRDAYERAGLDNGLIDAADLEAAELEAAEEFDEEEDGL